MEAPVTLSEISLWFFGLCVESGRVFPNPPNKKSRP